MSENIKKTAIEVGAEVIRGYAKSLPNTPGVYRMLDECDGILYVGKAKSLRKRVSSYTSLNKLSDRIQRMVAMTCKMEFVETETEAEALLLESNLIKKLKPHFNILLRDDKSFPYIVLKGTHDFPLVAKHRGKKVKENRYFGPYASAGDVNRTIILLQKMFMLRNCSDHVFASRSRPCLQYHIKRCTAPCVGKVEKEVYAEQVQEAIQFLEGKSRALQQRFSDKMKMASEDLDYETAALYRDRIQMLNAIQAEQGIHVDGLEDTDVVALYQDNGKSCVQVFFFRGGSNNGNWSYFPRHEKEDKASDILSAFLAQFYENKPLPREIVVSHAVMDQALLEEALSGRRGSKVVISCPSRGKKKEALHFAMQNAGSALSRHIQARMSEHKLLDGVAALFDMDSRPTRIEVYDNSHISGTNMVGAMIVAGEEGLQKNAYRKFNIKEAGAADDYGMMREVMRRRFKRAMIQDYGGDAGAAEAWPDLVLIDGGKGQYNAVKEVLEDLGIDRRFVMVSIAKGEDRHAGRETFYIEGRPMFQLPDDDPVLFYLQRLRDEAHRFAIGSHRARRQMDIERSPLDGIAGIGAKRKKALLHYFGSAKAVAQAGVKDLMKVEGVSERLAKVIYDYFHGS